MARIALLIILACLLSGTPAFCQSERQEYSAAVEFAKKGDIDFAFMHFRSLLNTGYRQEALFAVGEYYFLKSDYTDAVSAFTDYLREFPDSSGKPFALAYLLKIEERAGRESLVQDLTKKIVTLRRMILVFKDFKEYEFKSGLNRQHKVIYYIDKVEFYINGQLFARIPY